MNNVSKFVRTIKSINTPFIENLIEQVNAFLNSLMLI